MGTVLLNLLAFVVKHLIDAHLFEHIQNIVSVYGTRTDLTGDQKKQAVKDELSKATGDIKTAFQSTSGNLLNFAIEAAVVLFKKG